MARKHKGKYALMHGMGLCKYLAAVGTNEISGTIPLDGTIPAQSFFDSVLGIGNRRLTMEENAAEADGKFKGDYMGLMQGQLIGQSITAGFQGIMQIWGAALQHHLVLKQLDLQDRAMTLEENVATHKMTLESKVVDKTSKLALAKMDHDEELARIQKNRDESIAQIQSDAKVAIAGKKAVASAFRPQYFYGGPVAVG